MKNKLIAALLTLSMLLSQCLIMPTFAASDYEGHWAEEHIDKLITAGIVSGDENGKINPDNSIKRSEFVKIVNRKFNFTNASSENFPDVSANAWYANEFKIAKSQGYLTGDDKGNANPDKPITRAEVSVIIARVLKLNDDYSSAKAFSDDNGIPSWAKESVYRLNLKGYINGYPDGSFKAQNTITRAESFTIISKIQTNTSGSSSAEKPDNVEWREDGNIGFYTEVYSDKKVDNVEDAIESLEDVKDILNIENVDAEFIPFDDEGSKIDENTYKIQQVYNGVPVANAQSIISVNEGGYPDSILNRYDDSVRLSDINTTPSISEARAKEIILADLISKDAEYTNGNVESIYLEIQADQEILTYHAYVTCDNSLGFNYYVDAHSGEVVVANEIFPKAENLYYDSNKDEGSKINVIKVKDFTDVSGISWSQYEFSDKINNVVVHKYSTLGKVEKNYKLNIDTNSQWINPSEYVQRSAFYALYNMPKIIDSYKNIIGFNTKKQCQIAINQNRNNASYNSDKCFSFGYQATTTRERIRDLDTIGHEYTHYFQDYYVNDFVSNTRGYNEGGVRDNGFSFGDSCGQSVSGNLKWVEAEAISEGTADIMGMLSEYLAGEAYYSASAGKYIKIEFNSPEFWLYAEDSEYSDESEQEDHYTWAVNAINGDDWHHITATEIKNYYTSHEPAQNEQGETLFKKGKKYEWKDKQEKGYEIVHQDELPYMYGPGHNDRYVLVRAFSQMIQSVANETNNDNRVVFKNKFGYQQAEIWFKLWGNAIKKLTPSSDFADLRLALLQTANDMNFSQAEYGAVGKGFDRVGITASHNADTKSMWYRPYVNAARADESAYTKDRVITQTQADNAHLYLTRGELLKMVIDRCDIKVTHLNNDSYYTNKRYGQYVQLAYNYGAVNMQWLKSAAQEPDDSNSFLNQNIPRWEAMHLMYKLMNASEVHHEKTRVYGYSLSGNSEWNYAKFKNTFKDFGECVPDTNRDNIVNLLNMHRGYFESNKNGSLTLTPTSEIEVELNADGTYNSADWNKKVYGKDGGLETFLTEHGALADANIDKNYMSTNTCSEYTYSMLYYFGMYQLWVNGKFSGQSVNGEKMLKATDPITIGEACAIMYK